MKKENVRQFYNDLVSKYQTEGQNENAAKLFAMRDTASMFDLDINDFAGYAELLEACYPSAPAEQEQEAPAEAQEPAEKDYFRNGYYEYLEAITDDVKQYIQDEVNLQDFADRDELEEYLQDELWAADSVTGNASGSYYCNTWKAEEALCHNWDLLAEALQEFGSTVDVLQEGAEALDVTIRCYLLGQAIAEALDNMEVFDNE